MIGCRGLYIGGFRETCLSDAAKKFRPLGISCKETDWTLSLGDSSSLLAAEIAANDEGVLLVAFSLGCLVALEAAHLHREKVRGLVLCSFSPFFTGYDGPDGGQVRKIVGQSLFEDMLGFDAESRLALNVPCFFIYGQEEDSTTKDRIEHLFSVCASQMKQVVEVPECGHKISDAKYLETVCAVIEKLAPKV